MFEWSADKIDFLLYNRHALRKEVELLSSTYTSGPARIPPRGIKPHGSPVERAALTRAEITMVLDAVDRGWNDLPPDLKRIARAKYGRLRLTNQEIGKRFFLSPATVTRRLISIRAVVAGHLALQNESVVRRFWAKIEANWDALVKKTC
jgi:hypothetical protein